VILSVFIFTKVHVIAVILPNFYYTNKNFFWIIFGNILVGSFADPCMPSAFNAGSARGQRKSRVPSKPRS
jgi:hypothetical protein